MKQGRWLHLRPKQRARFFKRFKPLPFSLLQYPLSFQATLAATPIPVGKILAHTPQRESFCNGPGSNEVYFQLVSPEQRLRPLLSEHFLNSSTKCLEASEFNGLQVSIAVFSLWRLEPAKNLQQ